MLKGDPVVAEGRTVGEITSAIVSPTLKASIAIAMLATPAATVGQKIEVLSGDERVAGEVVPMPFLDPERKLSKV